MLSDQGSSCPASTYIGHKKLFRWHYSDITQLHIEIMWEFSLRATDSIEKEICEVKLAPKDGTLCSTYTMWRGTTDVTSLISSLSTWGLIASLTWYTWITHSLAHRHQPKLRVYIPHWFMFVNFPKISWLQNISIQLTVQAMIDWNHITLAVNVGLPNTLPALPPRTLSPTHTQSRHNRELTLIYSQ